MTSEQASYDRRSVLKRIGAGAVAATGATGMVSAGQPNDQKPGRAVAYIAYDESSGEVYEGEMFDLVVKEGPTRITCDQSGNAKGHKVMAWNAFGSGPWSHVYVQSNSLNLEKRDLIEVVKILGRCENSKLTKTLIERTEINTEEQG